MFNSLLADRSRVVSRFRPASKDIPASGLGRQARSRFPVEPPVLTENYIVLTILERIDFGLVAFFDCVQPYIFKLY